MPEPILEVTGITAGYVPDLPILRDVELTAREGEITLIVGPNGAGKSTLIKAIAGLVPISSGTVTVRGRDITRLRPDRMAEHGIAYVPQTDNIFRSLTIAQNLALALARRGGGPADALYARFPMLADKRHDKAGALSGGQRQFLAVAMALAADPAILLLDEPSAGLSPKAAVEVLDHVRELSRQGVSVILVEQNVKQGLRIADHCFILAEGRNQHDGPAAELADNRVLAEIYLGHRRARPEGARP